MPEKFPQRVQDEAIARKTAELRRAESTAFSPKRVGETYTPPPLTEPSQFTSMSEAEIREQRQAELTRGRKTDPGYTPAPLEAPSDSSLYSEDQLRERRSAAALQTREMDQTFMSRTEQKPKSWWQKLLGL